MKIENEKLKIGQGFAENFSFKQQVDASAGEELKSLHDQLQEARKKIINLETQNRTVKEEIAKTKSQLSERIPRDQTFESKLQNEIQQCQQEIQQLQAQLNRSESQFMYQTN